MENRIITSLSSSFDEFTFTLEEYTKDDGRTVRRDAEEYLAGRLHGIPSELIKIFLYPAIRRRCLSLLTSEAEWKNCPSEHCSALKCTIGGMEVCGQSVIEPKKIHVKLVIGNRILTKNSLLHEWAPRIFTDEPYIGSPANEEGKRVARDLFLLLFLESRAA